MKPDKNDFFWPSYTDLMTSLFFIMLVLYVLTYVRLDSTIKVQEKQLQIVKTVQGNLKPLREDTTQFKYEDAHKRYKLAFDVKFVKNKFGINANELEEYEGTIQKIDGAGQKLKAVIDSLQAAKLEAIQSNKEELKNMSYILVIAGYASRTGDEYHNYQLSYERALSLWRHWRDKGINFEAEKYKGLIDLQIAGNGWGGVGREKDEIANQRFLIQIFPKIPDLERQ
ncbi:OmpA family protein [Chitinophaga qingshengii]|uniref:OmpA family protein n=1 Tax=Chitinophaga qingshengii TaxID=1569794 RepID=A0ABR7TW09_9BACT|nr:OmpA family protein [Chitinophaga qingshengii]MBC9934188.1 OmpA family protein [Chitinophaga qingshengii]